MSYECKTLTPPLQGTAQVCTEWQEASFLPELTGADRDVILQWAIGYLRWSLSSKKIMRFFLTGEMSCKKTTQNRFAVINRKNIATYGLGAVASTALMSSNANALDVSTALTGADAESNIETGALWALGIVVVIYGAKKLSASSVVNFGAKKMTESDLNWIILAVLFLAFYRLLK